MLLLLAFVVTAYPGGSGTCWANDANITAGMGGALDPGDDGGFSVSVRPSSPPDNHSGALFEVQLWGPLSYNGFLLYAEATYDGPRVGRFVFRGDEATRAVEDCAFPENATITHTSPESKVNHTWTWDAGTHNASQKVTFRGAVVGAFCCSWYIVPSLEVVIQKGSV